MSTSYQEGNESFICFMARRILVDDLIRLAHEKPGSKMNPLYLQRHTLGTVYRFDQARVDAADPSIPVILYNDAEKGLMMLDGLHRTIKACQHKLAKIPVKILEQDDLRSIYQPL